MKLLHSSFDGEPFDKLQIAGFLARVQDQQGATADAVETLREALGVYAQPTEGRFDRRSSGHADMLIGWMQKLGRYRAAERLINRQLQLQQGADDKVAWIERLFGVGTQALRNGAALELGQGEALYLALAERMRQQLFGVPNRISRTLNFYEGLLQVAHKNASLRRASGDAVRFGSESFDELLGIAFTQGINLVSSYASSLKNVAGPTAALAFSVERIQKQPRWYSRVGYSIASRMDYSMARWRHDARRLEPRLEERLLQIVLGELEKDLLQGGRRMNAFYWRNYRYWWSEKRAEFGKTAGRVHEEHMDSVPIARRVATYYWDGLRRTQSAVDVLRGLEKSKKLDRGGQWQLVGWLQKLGEWNESLALLDQLLEHDRLNLSYRGSKVTALFRTGKRAEAVAFLDASMQLFKDKERWDERHISFLAKRCHDAELWERGARLYEELIPLHQRTRRNRGIGGGTLSGYYTYLARCYRGLGKWDEAVDAASAAVVSWGRNQQNRQKAIQSLTGVLRSLPGLDEFVQVRDELLAKTGEGAPLLRKLVGKVYLARRMPGKAAVQLELALELQDNDSESWDLLLRAYDLQRDEAAAAKLLRRRLARLPWELASYEELAKRLGTEGDEALRAWTSLAEIRPNEPAGHQKLAEHWQRLGHWQSAAQQWRQVVRTQEEDPSGWLSLAKAQAQAGDREGARSTVEQVLKRDWEKRFGDIKKQAAELLRTL